MAGDNKKLLLNILRREGRTSQSALARETGLTGAGISKLISSLIESQLVREGQYLDALVGRPPVGLEIDYSSRHAIGIKITANKMIAALTDLSSTPLVTIEMEADCRDPDDAVSACALIVGQLLNGREKFRETLVGIGVCLPGIVNSISGVCIDSSDLSWQLVPFGRLLSDEIRLPVYVDSCVSARAVYSSLFGLGKTCNSILLISLGTQIRSAYIIDGMLMRGHRFRAGEIGFCRDPSQTPEGSDWNARFSESTLRKNWSDHGAGKALGAALYSRERTATDLVRNIGRELGARIANLVVCLDPELTLICGDLLEVGPSMETAIQTGYLQQLPFRCQRVKFESHPKAAVRGAASVALQRIFY